METETLGQRIKRMRELRRWSQAELARELGVSTKTISNWERDRNDPRASLGALRELFGRRFDEPGDDASEAPAAPSVDPVVAAIDRSELVDWRKDEVRSVYRRNVDEQRREVGAG